MQCYILCYLWVYAYGAMYGAMYVAIVKAVMLHVALAPPHQGRSSLAGAYGNFLSRFGMCEA